MAAVARVKGQQYAIKLLTVAGGKNLSTAIELMDIMVNIVTLNNMWFNC